MRSKKKTLQKVATPTAARETIKPPELRRSVDTQSISMKMYVHEGDSVPSTGISLCPRAKLKDGIFGYRLVDQPWKGQVLFESIGEESDNFLKQLAAVSNVTLPENARMAKSVAIGASYNMQDDDDMTMLRLVYRACIVEPDYSEFEIVVSLDINGYVELGFKESEAKALVYALLAP